MTRILWLILAMGYGLMTWAAKQRKGAKAALCFLDGGYLAFLCFAVLPRAMGTELFYYSAGASGIGVIVSLLLEKRSGALLPAAVFALVADAQMFWSGPLSAWQVLFLGFFGGMGLYHASAGILPEKIEVGKALLSGVGFLFGTFLFAGF